MRAGRVFFMDVFAGLIEETEDGFRFTYDSQYLNNQDARPISLTMPLTNTPYISKTMFPVFDGIIPEGWILEIAIKNWNFRRIDRFGLLLQFCGDCIGAISIQKMEK